MVCMTFAWLFTACSKDKPKPANQAPDTFNLVGVTNGATNVDVMPNLSWSAATDPDGDAISYDLYIDSNENPTTLFAEDITATNYQLQERLSIVEQYYWKVVAKDNNGNTTPSDDTYSFTTRNLNFPNTPVTANAAFSKRWGHTTAVFDNKLWVIGGFGDGITRMMYGSVQMAVPGHRQPLMPISLKEDSIPQPFSTTNSGLLVEVVMEV